MKIISKFAFVALVACFVTMGAVKANAQSCDQACMSCMQSCGGSEAACFDGCGSPGGPGCEGQCIAQFESCSSRCYTM